MESDGLEFSHAHSETASLSNGVDASHTAAVPPCDQTWLGVPLNRTRALSRPKAPLGGGWHLIQENLAYPSYHECSGLRRNSLYADTQVVSVQLLNWPVAQRLAKLTQDTYGDRSPSLLAQLAPQERDRRS